MVTRLSRAEAPAPGRRKVAQDVLPALKTYEAAIRDTIGLRKQPKLPRDIVPDIASCMA